MATAGRAVLVWALGPAALVLAGLAVLFFVMSRWDLAIVSFFFVVSVAVVWSVVMGIVSVSRLRDSLRRQGKGL